jgi:hypothetical protein
MRRGPRRLDIDFGAKTADEPRRSVRHGEYATQKEQIARSCLTAPPAAGVSDQALAGAARRSTAERSQGPLRAARRSSPWHSPCSRVRASNIAPTVKPSGPTQTLPTRFD